MFKRIIFLTIFPLITTLIFGQPSVADKKPILSSGIIKLTFKNVVRSFPMVLQDSVYTNSFGENYSINKFKYYIGNVTVSSQTSANSDSNYHLVNQMDTASLSFSLPAVEGIYDSLFFLLGVDSLHNVSGAQTDALDPANDMFWTWNSGYVMAKMEGKSTSSALNSVFELHIGGFYGKYSVLKKIVLSLGSNKLIVREGKTAEVVVQADADSWWQNPNDIHISSTPVITTPGPLAKKISDNYSKMFSLVSVNNN